MQGLRFMVLIGLVGLIHGCTRATDIAAEQNALLATEQEQAAAANDSEKFLAWYSPDANLYPPGMSAISGTDGIRDFFAKVMSAPGASLAMTPVKATVGAGGDIGYTTGTYKATMNGVEETGKYLTVWKKQSDGSWKIAEDIFNGDSDAAGKPAEHKVQMASALTWGEVPPGLPKGGRVALVSGDPSQAGPFVLRAQLPSGYTVPPHWHGTDEMVTVLSGSLGIGMGDKIDPAGAQYLTTGGFAALPANMRHYAIAKGATVIQVHGNGPFTITYVNDADDPRRQTPAP